MCNWAAINISYSFYIKIKYIWKLLFSKIFFTIEKSLLFKMTFIGALRIKTEFIAKSGDKDYQDRILLIFKNNNKVELFDYHSGHGAILFIITDYKQARYGLGSFGKMINPTWDEFNILINPKYMNMYIYQLKINQ